jgi:hypothetical protein
MVVLPNRSRNRAGRLARSELPTLPAPPPDRLWEQEPIAPSPPPPAIDDGRTAPDAPEAPDAPDALEHTEPLGEMALLERLGPLEQVPRLTLPPSKLRSLRVNNRAAFLLSQVDGVCTMETILDISAMPRLDALRFLAWFVEQGVVALG